MRKLRSLRVSAAMMWEAEQTAAMVRAPGMVQMPGVIQIQAEQYQRLRLTIIMKFPI